MEQILPVIFIHLHIRDIIHVCTSSKILSEFLHSKSLWMSLILRDFLDCKPFKCPLFTKSSSISTSKLLSHYRAHFETSFSCGLGLRLSSDVIQLAVGDFLTFTTTIYNNTSLELEIPVGYSHIGKYYEQGALMRSDWDEQGYRRAVYSLHSPCLQSTHILAIIPPGSFVQFTSKAKLRDLVFSSPSHLLFLLLILF